MPCERKGIAQRLTKIAPRFTPSRSGNDECLFKATIADFIASSLSTTQRLFRLFEPFCRRWRLIRGHPSWKNASNCRTRPRSWPGRGRATRRLFANWCSLWRPDCSNRPSLCVATPAPRRTLFRKPCCRPGRVWRTTTKPAGFPPGFTPSCGNLLVSVRVQSQSPRGSG